VKRPFASDFVREASCIPCASRISTTSSPADGLFVDLFVTVPVTEAANIYPDAYKERAATPAATAKTRTFIFKGFTD
jgi:hypothetical protein